MLDDGGDVVVSRTHAFVVLDGRLVVHHESHVPHEECGEGDRERARYHQTSDDERGSFVVVKLGPARVEDFTRRKISEMVRRLAQRNRGVKQKQEETLVIIVPHAVIHPNTVICLLYTSPSPRDS